MSRDSELDQNLSGDLRKNFSSDLNEIRYVGKGRWVMHDGMPYGRIQGQGQGHSREVDRQSPTGLIFIIIIIIIISYIVTNSKQLIARASACGWMCTASVYWVALLYVKTATLCCRWRNSPLLFWRRTEWSPTYMSYLTVHWSSSVFDVAIISSYISPFSATAGQRRYL